MKDKIIASIFGVLAAILLGIVIILRVCVNNAENTIAALHPTCEYTYVNNLELIAQPMLNEYFKAYSIPESNVAKEDAFLSMEVKNSSLIAGNSEEFAISVIFTVQVNDPSRHSDWGIEGKDGKINCGWTLIIKKTGANEYTLMKIINNQEALVELKNAPDSPSLLNRVDRRYYKIENDQLYVTYDRGKNFASVPLPAGVSNFAGSDEAGHEYTMRLPEGSWYITDEKTAFVGIDGDKLSVIMSEDMGVTWRSYLISDHDATYDFCFALTFLPDSDVGYISVNVDKAMSSSATLIYKTTDGGETWDCLGLPNNDYHRISKYITASSEDNVFLTMLSDGGILASYDGGVTWEQIKLPIPQNKVDYYSYYNPPEFDGKSGEILVGMSYKSSSNIRFTSGDGGRTWKYNGEVICGITDFL